LQLFALAYNLATFCGAGIAETGSTLVPDDAAGKADQDRGQDDAALEVRDVQLAEVSVTRNLFAAILNRIARLAIPPPVIGRMPA
jgi:hypothetical protein